MSLTLLQSYSSAEEEEDDAGEGEEQPGYDKSEDEDDDDEDGVPQNRYKPLFNPNPSSSSSLPSALDAFSEVSGPPEFLNNSVQEAANDADNQQRWRHGRRKNNRDKKDLPSGAVVEAKAQLTGIHERVRSDVEGTMPKTSTGQRSVSSATAQGGKSSEDVLLFDPTHCLHRICLTCGIPKTYSHSRGIVCPMCGDRPATDEAGKKKGSTIKDKEKSKRMKGQSSHASWKSETEMALRQQFD
nr:uncharacterized protein LOC109164599 [Ipomoea batatas]